MSWFIFHLRDVFPTMFGIHLGPQENGNLVSILKSACDSQWQKQSFTKGEKKKQPIFNEVASSILSS